MHRVLIAGTGLTGSTLAHSLGIAGFDTVVLEREQVEGGLIRSAHMEGVLFEPQGSHIFHTDDAEVWALANAMTPFRPYRHRVDIVVDGGLYNWPILVSDLQAQSHSDEIFAELSARRDVDATARSKAANSEEWCLEIMGPTLYQRYIRPYTEKQWGRPARESLPGGHRVGSEFADNDPYLFPDAFQGWPAGPNGYSDLINGLLAGDRAELHSGVDVTVENVERYVRDFRADAVVLTCPLDVFAGACFGQLEWRGIAVRSVHVPHVEYAQGAMVVNYPGLEFPFIRVHETKHASGQQCEGTVLGFEFTNAPARHYPIETGRNRSLNDRYKDYLRQRLGPERTFFALAVEDSLPGAKSAVAAGIPTVGNVQFVPPNERQQRERQLRQLGVLTVVGSWTEIESLLLEPGDGPGLLGRCVERRGIGGH